MPVPAKPSRLLWVRLFGRACLLFFLCLAPTVAANDYQDPAQASGELKRLRARIADLQSELDRARGRESNLADQLRDVEREVAAVAKALRDTEQSLDDQKLRLRALDEERARQDQVLESMRDALVREVRAAYRLGRQERVKMILNQEDPALAGRALTYYQYLTRARASRIGEVELQLQRIARLSADIDEQRRELEQTRVQHAEERQALDRSRAERREVLNKVRTDIRERGSELKDLQANEQRLEKLLKELEQALADVARLSVDATPFADSKAQLDWPVQGDLVGRYGRNRGNGRTWRGAFVAAPLDAPVHAVSHGRVAFADWLRGFGLLMILDHGDGYMTLYGHNQALYKEVGEWVDRGEQIASVGDSGGLDRAGLYFEVRRHGEPVNPAAWCKGRPEHRAAR